MVNIMKVAIEVNGEVIWYRDSDKQEGMASLGYLKDGTQQKIIAALEDALFRAKGQLQISDSHDAAGKDDKRVDIYRYQRSPIAA